MKITEAILVLFTTSRPYVLQSNNVIYAKRIVTGLNRFYRGHFQNAPNIKTFFGYASQLTVEKANKSDHLADYLDLTLSQTVEASFQPGYTTNVMILTSTLSIFHSFPAACHLVLSMVCTFHSSLDMHDAAHTKRISDIATSAWLIDFCHKAIES